MGALKVPGEHGDGAVGLLASMVAHGTDPAPQGPPEFQHTVRTRKFELLQKFDGWVYV